MTELFNLETAGTQIELVAPSERDQWLGQQEDFVRQWLNANQFDSKEFALVPNRDGGVAKVVAVTPENDTFFIAGDLPNQLPPVQYCLSAQIPETLRIRFAISWGLACYRFNRYKSNDKALPQLGLNSAAELKTVNDYVSAIFLTRDLINTPASDMMPQDLSQEMQSLAREFDGTFTQVVGDDLLEQNYPTIHAVGRASVNEPRFLDLTWGDRDAPKVTLVGKGVCFDSGGLNMKPGNFMRLMKKDMGGAAHVLGLARLIMAQKLPIRLRVLVAAAENAVSANAFRPGDVIKTRKGLTVEIDNTDAEGRLVLCDALSDADDENPALIIDFATLTGACRVALGTEIPGFFCNHETTANDIFKTAQASLDPIWRLPLHAAYEDMLKSQVADTLNSSPTGMGGAITAALYLNKFVSKTTPWIHFDVMAWNDRVQPGRQIGGEAFGLRATFEYLKANFDNNK